LSVDLVTNSGPLISLARIDSLSLLPALYPSLAVPRAVFQEVTHDPAQPGARDLATASWLQVVEVPDRQAVDRLRFWLDPAESEAIVLAQSGQVPLAIDEQRGRRIAASLGVETTGTAGILLAGKRLGLLDRVTPLLDALLQKGVRLSPRLYETARRLAGEL
jgi:predicted nucleic acid-binding protein